MDNELRELDLLLTSLQSRADDLYQRATAQGGTMRGADIAIALDQVRIRLNDACNVLYDVLPPFAEDAPTITQKLEHAIRTRPPEGGWHEGAVPYPSDVGEVAGEIAAFIVELDESGTANGLLGEVATRLNAEAAQRIVKRWQEALKPLLEELTIDYLRPHLRAAGVENPDSFTVAYDVEPLALRPVDPFGEAS